MDKEQKNKLDQNVNLLAEKLYQLRTQNESKSEQDNTFVRLYNEIIRYQNSYKCKFSQLDGDDILSTLGETLIYQFPSDLNKGWKPEMGPFVSCFLNILKQRLINLTKKKIETPGTIINPRSGEKINPLELDVEEDPRGNPETKYSQISDVERALTLLGNEIRTLISMHKHICYERYFYTELIAGMLLSDDGTAALNLMPPHTETTVSLHFSDYFLENPVKELKDIPNNYLKKLSVFSEREEDSEKPCGNLIYSKATLKLKNDVFLKYFSSNKGKKMAASAISNHRKEFIALIESQRMKFEHYVTES